MILKIYERDQQMLQDHPANFWSDNEIEKFSEFSGASWNSESKHNKKSEQKRI